MSDAPLPSGTPSTSGAASPLTMVEMYRLIKEDPALRALMAQTGGSDGKGLSECMFDLLVASVPTLNIGSTAKDYGSDLVVPNPNIVDIGEMIANESAAAQKERDEGLKSGRITPDDAERMVSSALSRKDYVAKSYTNAVRAIMNAEKIPEGDPVPKQIEARARALFFYMHMAYCKITLKDMDVPPFIAFLFFTGKTAGNKNGVTTDLANYSIVNLGELDKLHFSDMNAHSLRSDDFTHPRFIANTMKARARKDDASADPQAAAAPIVFQQPIYDPRWVIQAFKRSKQGKPMVARINELLELYKGRLVATSAAKKSRNRSKKPAAAAAKTAAGAEEDEEEKEKEEEEEEDEKKEKKTGSGDKAAKKAEKEARRARHAEKRAKKEAKKAAKEKAKAEAEKATTVAAAPLTPTPPPTPRAAEPQWTVSDAEDLAALGVAPPSSADMASMHFYVDKARQTGFNAIPSDDEIVALLRHAARTIKSAAPSSDAAAAASEFDTLTWVRMLLTYLGSCNRSLYRAAAVELSALNRVDLPPLGTMTLDNIKQLAKQPEFVKAIQEYAMRIAILRSAFGGYAAMLTNAPAGALATAH